MASEVKYLNNNVLNITYRNGNEVMNPFHLRNLGR